MKNIILIILSSLIYAEDFIYHISIDNHTPYIKEPIILTLDINQTNADIVLMFNFDIASTNNYTAQRIDLKESNQYHNIRRTYTYIIYPLSQSINIDLKLIKKVTTDDSVAYSFSGDRDNVKGLVTKDTIIKIPQIQIQAKPLPKGTILVGDFKIDYNIPKHQAQSFEPLPFRVSISGKGYTPLPNQILQKDNNFTLFTQNPILKSNTTIYTMALSNDQNFTLSKISIPSFNPKTQQIYHLQIPQQRFTITTPPISQLIDQIDSPPPLSDNDYTQIINILSYMFTFLAGVLTTISIKCRKKLKKY